MYSPLFIIVSSFALKIVQNIPNWCTKTGRWLEGNIRKQLLTRMLLDLPAWMTIPMSVADVFNHQHRYSACCSRGLLQADADHENYSSADLQEPPEMILENCRSTVTSVAFHPKNKLLAAGCEDATIKVWDADTWKCRSTLGNEHADKHGDSVNSVVFIVCADGPTLLASGSDDSTAKIWDVDSETCLKTFLDDQAEVVKAVAFCDADGRLGTGSGAEVNIWQLKWRSETRECVLWRNDTKPKMKGRSRITSIDFYGDKWIAAGSFMGVMVWDAQTQEPVQTPEGSSFNTTSVAFNRGNGHLICGSDDGSIEVWTVEDSKFDRCLTVLDGSIAGNGKITSVAFHPTDSRFASACSDGTVAIWSPSAALEGGWDRAAILKGHSKKVTSVSFSMNDGRVLASGAEDQTVQLRNADRKQYESYAVHLLRKHSWVARLAHFLKTEIPGSISADTIGTNVETLYVAAFTFGGLSYTRTLLQAFDCTQNNDKSWYLDAEVTTKCMPSYSTIWPRVFLSVLLTTSCFIGGRSTFRMARGTEFVHISGARDDATESIVFCDSPRVRWPTNYIDIDWLRCLWDVMVWFRYWYSFFSMVSASFILVVPWKLVGTLGWLFTALWERLINVLPCKCTRKLQLQMATAAKQHAEKVEQELRNMRRPRAIDYENAVQAFTKAHDLSQSENDKHHNDNGERDWKAKLDEAMGNYNQAMEIERIEKAGVLKKTADDLCAKNTQSDRVSRATALAHYDHALLLDSKDHCNASAARKQLLTDLQASSDVSLWFDIIRPFGLSCMYSTARFVNWCQRTLEAKGSKERGTWKQSSVKWKLFVVALCTLYGLVPFYWWHRYVLPANPDTAEGSSKIDVYQKHERIVLLASIGLTLYVLGLVRYWIELQRQGTTENDLRLQRFSNQRDCLQGQHSSFC